MAFSKFKLLGKKASPYVWNGLAVAGLFAAADLSQQALEGRRGRGLDYESAGRMAVVGAAHGPLSYSWHKHLEALLPGTALRVTVAKVLLTNSIAGAFFTFLFYTGTSIVERKEDIFAEVREKWPKTYLTSWVYWPAINVINFTLLPAHYRGLSANFFGFIWTVILCIFKHHDFHPLKITQTEEDKQKERPTKSIRTSS